MKKARKTRKTLNEILEEARIAYENGRKLREKMKDDPRFKAFTESGAAQKVARLISMQYLINSIGNGYFETALELMESFDMVHQKVKTTSNNLTQSFDSYNLAISALIDTQEAKLQLCSDYQIFAATCDKFMNADVRIDDAGITEKKGQPETTETMKKPNPKQNQTRKVIAYESDGVKTFGSVKEAAEHYGIHIQSIYALINNGKETDGGVSFDYQKWED